jgi:hypothetical protein
MRLLSEHEHLATVSVTTPLELPYVEALPQMTESLARVHWDL